VLYSVCNLFDILPVLSVWWCSIFRVAGKRMPARLGHGVTRKMAVNRACCEGSRKARKRGRIKQCLKITLRFAPLRPPQTSRNGSSGYAGTPLEAQRFCCTFCRA